MKPFHLPIIFLLFLALPVWILGTWGFMRGDDTQPYLLEAMYRSLQLFALEGGENAPRHIWQWQIARFAAPASMLTVLVAFLHSFILACRHIIAKTFWREHTVVFGLDVVGLAIVHDLRQHRKRVMVIEPDPDHPRCEEARRLGAIVIHGDGRGHDAWLNAAAHRARSVVITTPDDETNIAMTLSVVSLLMMSGDESAAAPSTQTSRPHQQAVKLFRKPTDAALRREQPLIVCPHLVHRETRDLLRDQIVGDARRFIDIRDFSVYELAARELFESYPLDGSGVAPDSPLAAHLIIIGFGRMGRAVLLQALKLGHIANSKPLQVTIFDHHAGAHYELFKGCHPNLDRSAEKLPSIAKVTCVDGDVVTVPREDELRKIADHSDTLVTVVIAADTDIDSLRIARHLPSTLARGHVRVCVRMRCAGGISQLIRADRRHEAVEPFAPALHAFGELESICTEDRIIDTRQDELARAIHQSYLDRYLPKDDSPRRRQHEPWAALDEDFRDSNRQAADFIPVLLRSCGYDVRRPASGEPVKTPAEQAFTPEEIEVMAKLEHARWYAERYLAGWTHGEQRDDALRRHPHMVPWEKISEEVRQIDRDQVREYIRILRSLNQGDSAEYVVKAR